MIFERKMLIFERKMLIFERKFVGARWELLVFDCLEYKVAWHHLYEYLVSSRLFFRAVYDS